MVRDRVDPLLAIEIFQRDQMCIAAAWSRSHRCSGRLTLDHFWHRPGGVKGKRAPSDKYHLVTMCDGENNRPPSHDLRMFERRYIAHHYHLNLKALLRGDYEKP